MRTQLARTTNRTNVPVSLVLAGAFGTIHAAFSVFWAVGGTWLLWSVGSGLRETFHGREWLLVPIGVAKFVAASAPILFASVAWPARTLTRGISWFGGLVLIVWGGLNTVTGNLVLAGIIVPQRGYDRAGMIGHAYLWDPLFLAWGVALVIGLIATRMPRDHHVV